MSDRYASLALFAALALACAPALGAQVRGDSLDAGAQQLKGRVDSLRMALRAQEIAERDASLLPERRIAGVGVRTTARLQPLASVAADAAVARARHLLGADVDAVTGSLHLTLRERTARTRKGRPWFNLRSNGDMATYDRLVAAELEATYEGESLSGYSFQWPLQGEELQQSILTLIERAASRQTPDPLARWLEHQLPLRAVTDAFWTDQYRAFATAGAAVVRRCTAGDRPACRLAFGLDSLPTDRLATWYDESDLPALVAFAGDGNQRGNMYRSFSDEEREDCGVNGRIETCRRMLALLPQDALSIPMPLTARASLAQLALELGGPGAISRLHKAAAATVASQLSAAAGVPIDSLIGRWQQRLMAARPHSPLPSTGFVLASMACIVVCGAWAARSEPWK